MVLMKKLQIQNLNNILMLRKLTRVKIKRTFHIKHPCSFINYFLYSAYFSSASINYYIKKT